MAVKFVKKRDGRMVKFDRSKIVSAIFNAAQAVGGKDKSLAEKLADEVVALLEKDFKEKIPNVEDVQDRVEKVLMENGHASTAKSYVLYREQHKNIREVTKLLRDITIIDDYLKELDWVVRENSNMTYSLQGLNVHITNKVISNYWLNNIYPKEVRNAHTNGDFHIHDLGTLGAYCVGWDLKDLLLDGFKGVRGKIESKPAKHLNVALMQLVNFIYTLQGEAAGAQAVSNFDTLLAPFIKYDELSEKEVKQMMQEFLFNMNVPTRVGFQTPFSNITLDLKCPEYMLNEHVIIGGKLQKETYKEFQKEMEIINKIFAEVMLEGDAKGRPFTFPIPTYNITKDFDWESKNYDKIWEMTAKYGIPYFSNFINSDMNPDDARSMCPIAGEEKVLIKSSRGRVLEYSEIRNIFEGNSKKDEYEIYADGKFVKGKFNKFKNQHMIEVILANGHSIKMSKEHLNFVLKNKSSAKIEELKGSALKENMYLPYSLNSYKGEGGNEEIGYFVGAYAGDGSFDGDSSVVFSLENEKKKFVVEKIKDIANKYFGAHCSESKDSKTKLFTLKVHSKAAVGLCKDFVEGKEREKHYQPRLFGTSIEFRKAVVNGHYDTDGGNRNRIYTSSKKMIETLNMLAATLGTTTSVYKDERENRFGKETNYAVLFYQLNRKNYGDFWFKKQNKLWVKISSIKSITNSTAYCCEVKNDKPVFTVGTSGILTHNCRLRLDKRELKKRGGGLFGSNPLTGSVGVVTINLPRLAYLSKDENEFFERLESIMNLARESLVIKREVLDRFTDRGLYPYSRFYLRVVKEGFGEYWKNHFSTIGLVGMNEALLNLIGTDITTPEGIKFTEKTLDFMRDKLSEYQEETGDIFNLEATPAEGTSYRLAKIDSVKYPEIKFYNREKYNKSAEPYYTNSTQLPVGYTDDIFAVLKMQDSLQTKYTGGCIEKGNKVLTDKGLLNIEYITKNLKELKPIRAISYNKKKECSEWDEILEAVAIDVKKHDKIRVRGECNLDITTSDWHPFFVLEKIKIDTDCPICKKKIKNTKVFSAHLRYNPECKMKYLKLNKYAVKEKRADELKEGDYILHNTCNLYPNKKRFNKNLMWLIGFFIGDGSISEYTDNRGGNNLKKYKIRFFSSNEDALNKVKKILAKHFETDVNVIQNDKRSKELREITCSKKKVSDFFFINAFKTGKKVYDVSIPEKIKKNFTKENVFSFLSGLMDSDGHISKRDGDFEYVTASEKLAEDIIELCSTAGVKVSKNLKPTKRKNEVVLYRLRIPQYEMTRLKNKLEITVNPSRIKEELSNREKCYLPVIRVKEASKRIVNDNQFFDLMTKKNHNYLAGKNSLVFVHNTVLHGFLGESMPSIEATKKLVKKIAENFHLPYFTLTPTFSICPEHGYIKGRHETCPLDSRENSGDNPNEEFIDSPKLV